MDSPQRSVQPSGILNKTAALSILLRSKSFQTAKTEAPAGKRGESFKRLMTRIIISESHQTCSQTASACIDPGAITPEYPGDPLPSDLKARECNTVCPGGGGASPWAAHTTEGFKALALSQRRESHPISGSYAHWRGRSNLLNSLLFPLS